MQNATVSAFIVGGLLLSWTKCGGLAEVVLSLETQQADFAGGFLSL
jgi:hypothetical protein